MNDFERWVVDNLSAVKGDVAEVKTAVAILQERTKPKPKKSAKKWIINFTGLGALFGAIVALIKGHIS